MRTMNTLWILLPLTTLACNGGVKQPATTNVVDTDGPNIVIEESELDFGALRLGSLDSESITITNDGTDVLILTSLMVTPPFSTPMPSGVELQPNTSLPLTVQFNPTTYASVEGAITISSNDEDQPQISIPLFGETITDIDEDGFDIVDAGGTDCNDENADIYPGATDVWYDGIDNDCAGNNDYDQDGDGYETTVHNDDPQASGGDCQDNNPEMHPNAPDQWYDGVDSNCDGVDDFDQDGDGSRSLAYGRGSDCNDFDPYISTDGIETFNGVDDNCDGDIDRNVPAWNADVVIAGTNGSEKAGWAITAGDLDGNGKDELIIGSNNYNGGKGGVSVFLGESISNLSNNASFTDGFNSFSGTQSSDAAGTSLAVLSNFDGTNSPLVLIGAPGTNGNSGDVFLLEGDEAIYGGDLDDAIMNISGSGGNYVGRGISQDLDFDADGLSDIFGHYMNSSNNYYWLLYGGAPYSSINVSSADARLSTSGTHANSWRHMPSSGDLNGDGFTDIVHCDYRENSNGNYQGYYTSEINVFWGSSERYSIPSPQSISSVGSQIYSASGGNSSVGDGHNVLAACGIMPDWNGDGMDELWAYITQSDSSFTGVYVFDGNADWVNGADIQPLADASYFLVTGSNAPVSVFRNIGDWDGDSIDDVAIGFGVLQSGGGNQAWVMGSTQAPALTYTQANILATIEGDDEYNQTNFGNVLLSTKGDFDGDGLFDWAASDWGYSGASGTATNTGAVFINYNLSN